MASISAVALLAATAGGARSDQLYSYSGSRSDLSFASDPEAINRDTIERPTSQQLAPIAQNAAVELRLEAQKRVLVRDGLRKEQVSWQTLASDAPVQPGDVIRFVQSLNSSSQRQVKNLVLTQPIPPKTVYILNSATGAGSVTITYSTDSGKTYSATPEIDVLQPDGRAVRQPAPAANYTHIRWKFAQVTAPAAALATFQVAVK
ncbi:hypothetical protein [Kamptonema formosum]|uniref:hypothetical protein n=1 Tax=Kamptonema formosum TaxID=331992 RepID=UPI0003712FD7|nr:hypothetical protein [Oscillatoria sp. PCC 10802]